MKNRRIIAIAAASALSVSALSTGVFAAESFTDYTKAKLAEGYASYAESYDTMRDANQLTAGGPLNTVSSVQASLEADGQAFFTNLSGFDFSWLNDIIINMTNTIDGSQLYSDIDLLLNEAQVLTLNMNMDYATGDYLIALPDLLEGIIKMNISQASDMTGVNSSNPMLAMQTSLTLQKNLPDGETLQKILNRYTDIVLKHLTDTGFEQDTLNLNGISKDVTALHATISGKALGDCLREVLTTARDDADILSIFSGDLAAVKDKYIESIDQMLESLTGEGDSDEKDSPVFTLYVDENDAPQGFCMTYKESTPIAVYSLTDGDQQAQNWTVNTGDVSFSLSGLASVDENGILSGIYQFFQGDSPLLDIDINGYDTNAAKDGTLEAEIVLSPSPDDGSGSNPFAALGDVSLSLAVESDVATGYSSIVATPVIQGIELGTVSITNAMSEEPAAGVSEEYQAAHKIYDLNDENQIMELLSGFNLAGLFEKLSSAGLPEDLLNSLFGLGTAAATGAE